jgi:predicted transport protein
MEPQEQTMLNNLLKNTGKSIEQWVAIVTKKDLAKHGEIIKFLKEKHAFTHGFANLVAHKAKKSDANSAENPEALITQQYQGKEALKEIYDTLIAEVSTYGDSLKIAPKKAYVSLRNNKQFATLKPASKTRFEIGLNLKEFSPTARLLAEKPNAMCTHKLNVTHPNEVDEELKNWLRLAYNRAK